MSCPMICSGSICFLLRAKSRRVQPLLRLRHVLARERMPARRPERCHGRTGGGKRVGEPSRFARWARSDRSRRPPGTRPGPRARAADLAPARTARAARRRPRSSVRMQQHRRVGDVGAIGVPDRHHALARQRRRSPRPRRGRPRVPPARTRTSSRSKRPSANRRKNRGMLPSSTRPRGLRSAAVGMQRATERQQIVLVAAGAVQQHQRRLGRRPRRARTDA